MPPPNADAPVSTTHQRHEPSLTVLALEIDDTHHDPRSVLTAILWCPLLLSLGIHGLAVAAFLIFGMNVEPRLERDIPLTIRLRIIPPTPALPQEPKESGSLPDVAPMDAGPAPQDQIASTPVPAPSPAAPSFEPEPPQVEPDSEPARPALHLPTTLGLRQIVEEVRTRQEGQFPGCTALQEESELFDCGEEESRDFTMPRNRTYEFFTARRTPGRMEQTVGVLAARADEIEEQLLASGVSISTVDMLINQLETAAEVYGSTRNTKLDTLRDQIYRNDSTYQIMKRVMNPR